MFTQRNSRNRKPLRPAAHGLHYRRLGVERVEDRCMLAAAAFQTGMEGVLAGSASNAGNSLPIYAGPALWLGNTAIDSAAGTFGASGYVSLQTGTTSLKSASSGTVSANKSVPPAQNSSTVTTSGAPPSASNGLNPPPTAGATSAGTSQAASYGTATLWAPILDNGGAVTPGGPMQVVPVIVQSSGGSGTLQPIPVGLLPPDAPQPSPISSLPPDSAQPSPIGLAPEAPQPSTVGSLPPAAQQSAPQPVPMPAPIDIGLVLNDRLGPVQDLASPADTGAAPGMVGSGPTSNAAPSAVAAKPDVEGNRGKSQLFDVAGTQGTLTEDADMPSQGAFMPIAFVPPSDQATSAASDATAPTHATAPGDDSNGRSNSAVALGLREGLVADGTHFAVASDKQLASATQALQASALKRGTSAGLPAAAAVAASPAVSSDFGEADLSVSAGAKSEKHTRMSFTAAVCRRFEAIGLALLAFAGQHLGQRWSRSAFFEPRPIVIGRKKRLK